MLTPKIKEAACCGCNLIPFCSGSEKNPQADKLPIKRRLVLQKHEELFAPKRDFQYLFAIEKGSLKSVQIEADGSELVRGFYFSGEVLGYESIHSGFYNYSAIALTETQICMLDYHEFLSYLQSNPELQKHILNLFSLQLNIGTYLVSTKADRKLASFLLDLSHRLHRTNWQHQFLLPMSRQDIGNYLRLTTETVSRTLTRLQQNKIILIKNKMIQLIQPDALKQIADGLNTIG